MFFNARFQPDSKQGGFVVTFPDFDWGVTQGEDEAEANEMAADALALMIQDYIDNGRELPQPRKLRGRNYRTIQLPALQDAKVELYRAFLASGIRKSELARRLVIPKTVVDRLFDLRHRSRLDQIEAAFRALGKKLSIDIRDAA